MSDTNNNAVLTLAAGQTLWLDSQSDTLHGVQQIQMDDGSHLYIRDRVFAQLEIFGVKKSYIELKDCSIKTLISHGGVLDVDGATVTELRASYTDVTLLDVSTLRSRFHNSNVYCNTLFAKFLEAYDTSVEGVAFVDSLLERNSSVNLVTSGAPPREGAFFMWKRALSVDNQRPLLVKLFVPADAKRVGVNAVRVSRAIVCGIWDIATGTRKKVARSFFAPDFVYEVGKAVVPHRFTENNTTYAGGVAGYLSREMAIRHPF